MCLPNNVVINDSNIFYLSWTQINALNQPIFLLQSRPLHDTGIKIDIETVYAIKNRLLQEGIHLKSVFRNYIMISEGEKMSHTPSHDRRPRSCWVDGDFIVWMTC